MIKKAQQEDVNITKTMHHVTLGKKPTFAQIERFKSRTVCMYLWQFNQLVLRQGVLHRIYDENGCKYHHLVLPLEYHTQATKMHHDIQGHQVGEYILSVI